MLSSMNSQSIPMISRYLRPGQCACGTYIELGTSSATAVLSQQCSAKHMFFHQPPGIERSRNRRKKTITHNLKVSNIPKGGKTQYVDNVLIPAKMLHPSRSPSPHTVQSIYLNLLASRSLSNSTKISFSLTGPYHQFPSAKTQ
jgi:hypothetical protein